MSELTVYAGREVLGRIVEGTKGHWRAFDAEGRPLGHFPSRGEAIAAIPHARPPQSPAPRQPPTSA